jgi:hypothetical protein
MSDKSGPDSSGRRRRLDAAALAPLAKGAALGMLALLFLALSYRSHASNRLCALQDQSSYLAGAQQLRSTGGLAGFLRGCITGRYQEAIRHPLYLLALSPLASRDMGFFIRAKLLSTALAAVFFALFFLFVRREHGFAAAAAAAALLLCTRVFVMHLSWVSCEYLLLIFTVLAWHFTFRGFADRKLWVLAGACSGLAYLAKPNGLILLPAFVLSALLLALKARTVKRLLKDRHLYLYVAAFALAAAPLLTRNVVSFGNPFYNEAVRMHLLSEDPELYLSPRSMERLSLRGYLATCTAEDAVRRLASGARVLAENYAWSLRRAPGPALARLYGLALILALVLMILTERRERAVYCAVFIGLTCLSLTAMGISSERHLMPALCLLAMSLGAGLGRLLERSDRRLAARGYPAGLAYLLPLAALASFSLGRAAAAWRMDAGDVRGMYAYAPGDERLASWLETHLKKGDVIVQPPHLKPYVLSSMMMFNPRLKGRRIEIPSGLDGREGLREFAEKSRASYLVVNRSGLERRGGLFAELVEDAPGRGLRAHALPPGWKLAYADPEPPAEFLVIALPYAGAQPRSQER